MDITIESVVAFLAGGTLVATTLTQFIKYLFDKWVKPRFQPITTQAILFAFCLLLAGLGIGWGYLPDWFVGFAGLMFSIGIALYEVLYGIIIGKKKQS